MKYYDSIVPTARFILLLKWQTHIQVKLSRIPSLTLFIRFTFPQPFSPKMFFFFFRV